MSFWGKCGKRGVFACILAILMLVLQVSAFAGDLTDNDAESTIADESAEIDAGSTDVLPGDGDADTAIHQVLGSGEGSAALQSGSGGPDNGSEINNEEYQSIARFFYEKERGIKEDKWSEPEEGSGITVNSGQESGDTGSDALDLQLNSGETVTVHFDTGESEDEFDDQTVTMGGLITKPTPDPYLEGCVFYGWFTDEMSSEWDPDAEDAKAKLWDFEKDVVAAEFVSSGEMWLYAYFIPVDMFSESFKLTSSTEKSGYYTDTVIGQGCSIKLFPTDRTGTKLKIAKGAIEWQVAAMTNEKTTWTEVFLKGDTKLPQYVKFKNGKIKCKKSTPVGYKIAVKAKYNNNSAYYIMTVMPKVKKFGYPVGGKIKTSVKVELTTGSYCDYGYGGMHFIGEGNYPRYYAKDNAAYGVGLYRQPNGTAFNWPYDSGLSEKELENWYIQSCACKLPKKATVSTRTVSTTYGTATLYYFVGSKAGSYKVNYISPDGSGKKFTVTFKVKKPKKVKSSHRYI